MLNISRSIEIEGNKFELNTEYDSYHWTPSGSKHIMIPTEILLVKTILNLLEESSKTQ